MSTAGEGDKRKVSTDALETLGTILNPGERRDAIHLAVDPAVAGQRLAPGQHVELKDGRAYGTKVGAGVGIVDPFLFNIVEPGESFWLVVYPRQIHSLRHVWTHPAFPDAPEVAGEIPKVAIRQALASVLPGKLCTCTLTIWPQRSTDADGRAGTVVPEKAKDNFFSCSC